MTPPEKSVARDFSAVSIFSAIFKFSYYFQLFSAFRNSLKVFISSVICIPLIFCVLQATSKFSTITAVPSY